MQAYSTGQLLLLFLSAAFWCTIVACGISTDTVLSDCKYLPSDACWPTISNWASLNKTVGDRLIATVPLAAPCHDDKYATSNSTRCAELQNSWMDPETQ